MTGPDADWRGGSGGDWLEASSYWRLPLATCTGLRSVCAPQSKRYSTSIGPGNLRPVYRLVMVDLYDNRSRMTLRLARRPLKLEVQGSGLDGSTPLSH